MKGSDSAHAPSVASRPGVNRSREIDCCDVSSANLPGVNRSREIDCGDVSNGNLPGVNRSREIDCCAVSSGNLPAANRPRENGFYGGNRSMGTGCCDEIRGNRPALSCRKERCGSDGNLPCWNLQRASQRQIQRAAGQTDFPFHDQLLFWALQTRCRCCQELQFSWQGL